MISSAPSNDGTRGWEAIAIHPDDNVAVALTDLTVGATARVRRRGNVDVFSLKDAIPLGHKFALEPLACGAVIRKYGESIGIATVEIPVGAHVHVHNLRSQRARKPN